MNTHNNARLTFIHRQEMGRDIVEQGMTPVMAATMHGVSRRETETATPTRPANMPLSGTRTLPPMAVNGDVVRVDPMLTLPDVLTALGVAPRRAFRKARVQPGVFGNPENVIDYRALGRLLSICVKLTGCGHFGLLVGARATLASCSHLGELMRHSPTVGEAMRVLLLHLYLRDRIPVPVLLRPELGTVLLGCSTTTTGMDGVDQLYDGAIAIAYKLLRELCGPSWKPAAVQFAFRPRSDIGPYRKVFNAPVRFAQQVQRVVHQLVLGGALSSANVAGMFAISERALRLRLQAEGTSLHAIVEETRHALARQLMLDTRMSIAEISAALGNAGPPGFSRAFRKWTGGSPRRWRAAHNHGQAL